MIITKKCDIRAPYCCMNGVISIGDSCVPAVDVDCWQSGQMYRPYGTIGAHKNTVWCVRHTRSHKAYCKKFKSISNLSISETFRNTFPASLIPLKTRLQPPLVRVWSQIICRDHPVHAYVADMCVQFGNITNSQMRYFHQH